MDFYFVSPISFEPWDWRNSVEKGIGGSETSTVENAWRLARRGHKVVSYANIPDDCPGEWRGTKWLPLEAIDYSQPGIWILYRCPEYIDKFDHSRSDQVLWLCAQDWDYPALKGERLRHLDRLMVLCRSHEKFLHRTRPELRDKTWVTRNAMKGDLVAEVEAEGVPPRNPHRIMYASSPDRGLKSALLIYQRAKEVVPDLELHCTYGYDNLNKMIANGGPAMDRYRRDRDECLKLVEETGAVFHGRLTQKQLYREWLKTGINVYCTSFFETGYITGLESQALGAIPVFSPIYAQAEVCKHGITVVGNPDDESTIARFAAEVVRLATDQGLQDRVRAEMVPDVRANWDWEGFVQGWERAAEMDLAAYRPASIGPVPYQVPDNEFSRCDLERADRERWLDLKPGEVMLDLGCAGGSWTIPAAAQGATVYAVDVAPLGRVIAAAAARNGFADRVRVVRAMVVGPENSGRETVVTQDPSLSGLKTSDCPGDTAVPAKTVDEIVRDERIPWVDYVKVDIEGAEVDAVRGMADLVATCRPRLMVEVHGRAVGDRAVTVEQVLDALCAHGHPYTVEAVDRQDGWYYHAFCTPAEPAPRPLVPAVRFGLALPAHAPPGVPVEAIYGLCDNLDEAASRARWLHLSPGDVMIDVGCGDGSWAIPAAQQGATVYAFDANMSVQISQAIAAVGPAGRVEVFHQFVNDGTQLDGGTRLDLFAVERDLPRVDFVKIDVEGHELDVLRGALWVLKRFRPRVMVEVHTATVADVCVRPEQVTKFFEYHRLPYTFDVVPLSHEGRQYYHLLAAPAEAIS